MSGDEQAVLCCRCGEEFAPEAGRPASMEGVCPACADPAHGQDIQSTRALTESEQAVFIFPERFQPKLVLGEGAYGIVSKCWDIKLRRFVAIKRPKHQTVNQDLFLREARAASQLSHPNIVRIFDVGEHHETAYIVSEFIDGLTLRHWLNRNQPSFEDISEKCGIMADAIANAHDHGVIHRDLKPGNILMDQSGQPMIVDFGLSHSRNTGVDTLLVEGRPIGTPAYMSPEQVRGQAEEINTWSDVYSLGTILYQMLTGRLPFSGNSREVLHAIVSDPPPSPRLINDRIPAPLESICLKALAKKHEDRYQTAREFANELRNFREGRPLLAHPGMYKRRANLVFRRNFLAGLAGVCGVLLAGGIYWAWRESVLRSTRIPVMIDSSPPGARLTWIPFDFEKGEFAFQLKTGSDAGKLTQLEPGFYKIQAVSGQEYFEVFRTIPNSVDKSDLMEFRFKGGHVVCAHRWSHGEDGVIQLKPVNIVPEANVSQGMVWFSSGKAAFPDEPQINYRLKGKSRNVGQFLMDPDEVSWGDLKKVFPDMRMPEGVDPDVPATGIMLNVALAYCEMTGKNLPTVYELQFAATNSGTTGYPWGNQSHAELQTQLGNAVPGDWDNNHSSPQVKNLYGSAAEWTETVFVAVPFQDETTELSAESLAPTFGANRMVSAFPESWLTVSGKESPWVDGIDGFMPFAPGGDEKKTIGFRTVRRLKSGE